MQDTKSVPPSRKAKLHPQSISKSLNRLCNLVRAGRGKRRTEEHLFLGGCAIRLEPATARDEHAVVHGSVEDFFFDLVAGFTGCEAGVFLPVDVDPVLRLLVLCLFASSLRGGEANLQTSLPQGQPSEQSRLEATFRKPRLASSYGWCIACAC